MCIRLAGAATPRPAWTGTRTPSPFTDGMPKSRRDAAAYQGPRAKAEAERPRAPTGLGPQPGGGGPAPLAPAPAQLPGLIQACGKRMGDGAQRRPGTRKAPCAAGTPSCCSLGSCLLGLRNLLNCDSPRLRGAGPGPARALSAAAAGCGEPRSGGLAGQGAHRPLDSRPSTPRPRDCGGSAAFQRC